MNGDLWIVDEAQELTDEQQGSFLPLLAASKNPQTIYIGTPPDENAPGEVFTRIRKDALSGKTQRTAWSEWSVDEIGDVSDKERWTHANPSLGYMIRETTIDGELEQMAPDKFARERLGWWSEQSAKSVITLHEWDLCKTDNPPEDGVIVYAVKFSPDGARGSISVCLKPEDGVPYVECIENRSTADGIQFFEDWLVQRKGNAAQIVIDGQGNAQALNDRLLAAKVGKKVIIRPRSWDMAAACSSLLNAVRERRVEHFGQEALDISATKSSKRQIGNSGGWGFNTTEHADSTLIESVALAYWGAMNTKRNPNRKQRVG